MGGGWGKLLDIYTCMNIVCDVPFASGKPWDSMSCGSNAAQDDNGVGICLLPTPSSNGCSKIVVYTSLQLCQKLATERQVHLSQRTMSRLLQKRGSVGNEYATVRLPPNSQSL
jgi:hypothetical protein